MANPAFHLRHLVDPLKFTLSSAHYPGVLVGSVIVNRSAVDRWTHVVGGNGGVILALILRT